MPTIHVLFIQGGGQGAHEADAPLADSLRRALGAGYDLRFPRMPDEADPTSQAWKQKIASELARLHGPVVLVGHSLGGSMMLKTLAEEEVRTPVACLVLLAAPSWDGERWNFDDLKLPGDTAEKLARIPRVTFYHCRDDEIVPFAHLALHGARIPRAVTCALEHGGHQFGNDLGRVAADIRGDSFA